MAPIFHWGASAMVVLLYGYVIGTLLWLIIVAPGAYKRQRELLRRVEKLEQRMGKDALEPRTI